MSPGCLPMATCHSLPFTVGGRWKRCDETIALTELQLKNGRCYRDNSRTRRASQCFSCVATFFRRQTHSTYHEIYDDERAQTTHIQTAVDCCCYHRRIMMLYRLHAVMAFHSCQVGMQFIAFNINITTTTGKKTKNCVHNILELSLHNNNYPRVIYVKMYS